MDILKYDIGPRISIICTKTKQTVRVQTCLKTFQSRSDKENSLFLDDPVYENHVFVP